ncbi:YhdT family protein [Bacillus rubiinfantis]|uniref:YhdT family protein n=1 Tax=Bacillus rubiinfantis TaxID=1499680 RepID=UPI0005A6A3CD|nr:YhdT family protein [Bacillus rubiinfantis]
MNKHFSQKDKRFKIAHREALIGVGLVIFNFTWWYGFAYGLGSKKVEEYTYIWGLPAWFFYSCIAGFIIMVLLVTLTVKFFFKDIPFEEEGEERQ